MIVNSRHQPCTQTCILKAPLSPIRKSIVSFYASPSIGADALLVTVHSQGTRPPRTAKI